MSMGMMIAKNKENQKIEDAIKLLGLSDTDLVSLRIKRQNGNTTSTTVDVETLKQYRFYETATVTKVEPSITKTNEGEYYHGMELHITEPEEETKGETMTNLDRLKKAETKEDYRKVIADFGADLILSGGKIVVEEWLDKEVTKDTEEQRIIKILETLLAH